MTVQQRLKYNIMWANKWRRQHSATSQAQLRAITAYNASAGHTRRGLELTTPGTIKFIDEGRRGGTSTVSRFFPETDFRLGAMSLKFWTEIPGQVQCAHEVRTEDSQAGRMGVRQVSSPVDTEEGRKTSGPVPESEVQGVASAPGGDLELWRRAADAVRRINAENPGLRYAELGQEIEEDEPVGAVKGDEGE